MPLEKKYRHVQGLQSRNFRKKGNPNVCKAKIPVKMAVRKISLPEFPEKRPLQRCAKPDFLKSRFATMRNASGKKIRMCATLHKTFSAGKWQVETFTHHFRRNMTGLDIRIAIFRRILPFLAGHTCWFLEMAGRETCNLSPSETCFAPVRM